jgi:hypothetical protein
MRLQSNRPMKPTVRFAVQLNGKVLARHPELPPRSTRGAAAVLGHYE